MITAGVPSGFGLRQQDLSMIFIVRRGPLPAEQKHEKHGAGLFNAIGIPVVARALPAAASDVRAHGDKIVEDAGDGWRARLDVDHNLQQAATCHEDDSMHASLLSTTCRGFRLFLT